MNKLYKDCEKFLASIGFKKYRGSKVENCTEFTYSKKPLKYKVALHYFLEDVNVSYEWYYKHERKIIATRYIIENIDQFKFLILNSSRSIVFKFKESRNNKVIEMIKQETIIAE